MIFTTKINYQQVMTEFLLGVKSACLEDPNPDFADFKYKSFEELLLAKGQFFKKGKAEFLGKKSYCFDNAQRYIFDNPDPNLYYCEGCREETIAIRMTRNQIGENEIASIFNYQSLIGLQLLKEGKLIMS